MSSGAFSVWGILMKQNNPATNRVLRLRQQTEKMLSRSASSLKKMSATDIRNLLEDLQIYQVETGGAEQTTVEDAGRT